MHCVIFVILGLILCKVSANAPPIEKTIKDYYTSDSVKNFRSAWEYQRIPMQNALIRALAETVGLPGMNVYIRKLKEKIAIAYIHNDNHVQLILNNLHLKGMPRFRMPDLQFSLASNVLKVETKLSKMVIHADYSLVRDQRHIIQEKEHQDPFKYSPFLYVQVEDVGRVAISVDGCTLTGFVITTLSGNSVNVGYGYFNLINCVYTIEIYQPNQNSLPVIAKYNLDRDGDSVLALTDLMLRPLLSEELMPKLQASLFSFVNTSAIFGSELTTYRTNQKKTFQSTAQYMTDVIRNLNRITLDENQGMIEMEDYTLQWHDGYSDVRVNLVGMTLFGVDTMYSAHCGGPVKMDTAMITEEIRFSSLQVRGMLQAVTSNGSETFNFASEIIDLVIDVHMGENQWEKGFRLLEVKGLRRMSFTLSTITHPSEESMISGFLLNEVPKLIHRHLKSIFPKAVHPSRPEF